MDLFEPGRGPVAMLSPWEDELLGPCLRCEEVKAAIPAMACASLGDPVQRAGGGRCGRQRPERTGGREEERRYTGRRLSCQRSSAVQAAGEVVDGILHRQTSYSYVYGCLSPPRKAGNIP